MGRPPPAQCTSKCSKCSMHKNTIRPCAACTCSKKHLTKLMRHPPRLSAGCRIAHSLASPVLPNYATWPGKRRGVTPALLRILRERPRRGSGGHGHPPEPPGSRAAVHAARSIAQNRSRNPHPTALQSAGCRRPWGFLSPGSNGRMHACNTMTNKNSDKCQLYGFDPDEVQRHKAYQQDGEGVSMCTRQVINVCFRSMKVFQHEPQSTCRCLEL
jgi:hypothetical protein